MVPIQVTHAVEESPWPRRAFLAAAGWMTSRHLQALGATANSPGRRFRGIQWSRFASRQDHGDVLHEASDFLKLIFLLGEAVMRMIKRLVRSTLLRHGYDICSLHDDALQQIPHHISLTYKESQCYQALRNLGQLSIAEGRFLG